MDMTESDFSAFRDLRTRKQTRILAGGKEAIPRLPPFQAVIRPC